MLYGGVVHRARFHNHDSLKLLHWPWSANSCGFDSTMTFFWVLYVNLKLIGDKFTLTKIADQYPKVYEVFEEVYSGNMHNVAAKELLFSLFHVDNINWKRHNFVQTELTFGYLKTVLFVPPSNINDSLFTWRFEITWHCPSCEKCIGAPNYHSMNEIGFFNQGCTSSVDDTIQKILNESVMKKFCHTCIVRLAIRRRTFAYPTVLHLCYFTGAHEGNGVAELPAFLDREIQFDGIQYTLVGATYGNGSHFIFRYVIGSEVFEADGLQRDYDGVRSAISVPLNEDNKISFPGEIINSSGRGRNYKINDVYYRLRPADYTSR